MEYEIKNVYEWIKACKKVMSNNEYTNSSTVHRDIIDHMHVG